MDKLKLLISEVIHKDNLFKNIEKSKNALDDTILSHIREEGFYKLDSFISKETCNEIIDRAEEFLKRNPDKVTKESNGADLRVYGIDRYTDEFYVEESTLISNKVFKRFSYVLNQDYLLLLGKISASETNSGSGSGWHRDSPFTHQFKTILYLTDVDKSNGPFQYIKGSHLKKSMVEVSNKLNIPLSKYRFKEEEIETIIKSNIVPEPSTILGKAGTLLFADVRGLHRGMPLLEGERLALTNYHLTSKRKGYYDKK